MKNLDTAKVYPLQMEVPWSVGLAQKCTPVGALGSVGLKKESTPDSTKGTL